MRLESKRLFESLGLFKKVLYAALGITAIFIATHATIETTEGLEHAAAHESFSEFLDSVNESSLDEIDVYKKLATYAGEHPTSLSDLIIAVLSHRIPNIDLENDNVSLEVTFESDDNAQEIRLQLQINPVFDINSLNQYHRYLRDGKIFTSVAIVIKKPAIYATCLDYNKVMLPLRNVFPELEVSHTGNLKYYKTYTGKDKNRSTKNYVLIQRQLVPSTNYQTINYLQNLKIESQITDRYVQASKIIRRANGSDDQELITGGRADYIAHQLGQILQSPEAKCTITRKEPRN